MSTTPLFKPGDIVHLKSGGPNMTIAYENSKELHPEDTRSYLVGWFNNNNDYVSDNFEEYALSPTLQREFEPVLHKMPHDFSVTWK